MALLMKPEPFSREVDRLFDAFFGGETQAGARRWVPPMDLVEAEDHFVLKADLPGVSEKDVSIEVQDGTLSISGERKAEHESSERGWYRIERSFGGFNRSLTLPEGVDPDSIAAHFDRGVLGPEDSQARGAQAAPRGDQARRGERQRRRAHRRRHSARRVVRQRNPHESRPPGGSRCCRTLSRPCRRSPSPPVTARPARA